MVKTRSQIAQKQEEAVTEALGGVLLGTLAEEAAKLEPDYVEPPTELKLDVGH